MKQPPWDEEKEPIKKPLGNIEKHFKGGFKPLPKEPVNTTPPDIEFSNALHDNGFILDGGIIGDGKIHRLRSREDKAGKKSGWYVFFPDGIASGAYGDWRSVFQFSWTQKTYRELTAAEMEENRLRMEAARKECEQEQARLNEDAAHRAAAILDKSGTVSSEHQYLLDKNVAAYGMVAQSPDGKIIIPMQNIDGELRNVQRIGPDGEKRFLLGGQKKGCFFLFGDLKSSNRVFIVEGYSTGFTVHKATNCAVMVAFDAGNLKPVAMDLRKVRPSVEIIIAGDNDQYSETNIGLVKAKAAAEAAKGTFIIPEFTDTSEKPTDFNDLAKLQGIDAVKRLLTSSFEFLELEDDLLKPYEWVIDNLIYTGQMNISGSQGVGKTTSIVPICLGICGAVEYDNVPISIKRKVLYITEDPDQVYRLLHGAKKYQNVDPAYLREWFKILPAEHRNIEQYAGLAEKVKQLETQHSCKTGLQTIKPLVVFDTVSNAIAMENENDNTEAAQIISRLRTYLDCPHWLVTHMPKSVDRAEVESMSSRGAGAWEANVQGVFRLFADESDTRIFYGNSKHVKRRDFGKVTELSINGEVHSETRIDRFGEPQEIPYFVADIKTSSHEEREQKREQDKQNVKNLNMKSLEKRILAYVSELAEKRKSEQFRHEIECYPSKNDLENTHFGDIFTRGMAREVIHNLIHSGELVERTEPKGTIIFGDGKSRARNYFTTIPVQINDPEFIN